MENKEIKPETAVIAQENKAVGGFGDVQQTFQILGVIGFVIAILGLFLPFCQFPLSGSHSGWAVLKAADKSVVMLLDTQDEATAFATKSGAGHIVEHRPGSWFGGGYGTGVMVFILSLFGISCFLMRFLYVPIAISLLSAFLWFLDVLTTYDLIAIHNGTTGDREAPFRLIFHIFRDALRFGNGAFFVCFGLLLVVCSAVLAIVSDILDQEAQEHQTA